MGKSGYYPKGARTRAAGYTGLSGWKDNDGLCDRDRRRAVLRIVY